MVGVTALLFFVGDRAATYRQPPQGDATSEAPRLISHEFALNRQNLHAQNRASPFNARFVWPYVGVSKRHL